MANDTKHLPLATAVARPTLLTGAEALAVSAAAAPAATIVGACLIDRIGLPFPPLLLFAAFLLGGAGAFRAVRACIDWHLDELMLWFAIVGAIFIWLLWIASPSLLPLGSGSDLTHHLLLIQLIETHWRLAHDPGVERFLGEMTNYTPGSHILAAASGAWSGTRGLNALYPVLAATVALKSGFIFLIARRAMGTKMDRIAQLAFACVAVAMMFASKVYFLRSFVENSFVAQVAGELFAVVMWWSLFVWDTGLAGAMIFGAAGVATFLTWPVWIGPPVVAAAVLALTQTAKPLGERASRLLLACGPLAAIGVLYFAASPGGVAMAGTSGAAPWPQVSAYGRWFVTLSGVGLVIAATRREYSVVTIFAGAVLLQSAVLYFVAGGPGAEAPYLALKMFYLLLYPQAVAAALAIAEAWRAVVVPLRWRRGTQSALVLLMASAIIVAVSWPLRRAPRSLTTLKHPSISAPLEQAGQWARAHVPPACVEYLVDLDETAYWLHLAVLGNPRLTTRSLDPDTYKPGMAIARWLTPGGLTYGIADFATLPRGVREELDVLQQFDTAAVVKRRGVSSCPPEQ